MSLAGTTFRALTNSSRGTLNADTRMTFESESSARIAGVYSGGTIDTGRVVALRTSDSTVTMLYQCITTAGELKAGQASAKFSRDADRRLRMHLDWQWLTGDRATGASDWIEEKR